MRRQRNARSQTPVSDTAGGMSEEALLAQFPQLVRDDIKACLAYAAERERRTSGIPAA